MKKIIIMLLMGVIYVTFFGCNLDNNKNNAIQNPDGIMS